MAKKEKSKANQQGTNKRKSRGCFPAITHVKFRRRKVPRFLLHSQDERRCIWFHKCSCYKGFHHRFSAFLNLLWDPRSFQHFGLVVSDSEDQAAKISAEEQMQMTNIHTLESDINSVKSEIAQVVGDTEKMNKSKVEICSTILENQKKLAALESDSSRLTQV
ncbi:uncharacterized protein LOC131611240 isoform X1 [Vicia villosa]|uniref:uncharacterized protein LOC131611240 isoform X1 n=1 Tax=Vicia villosa TaxID=3911 RepID=UPI00273C9585|nr:uncharacterized protein LOC131611240 isoform X1 [Vicia villosa]